jgi:hypothetical protein
MMVGQSHDSFTLLSVKDVMLFWHCQQAIRLLPFKVGQSHDSFTLLSVKDVILFWHCQQAIQVMCTGQEAL